MFGVGTQELLVILLAALLLFGGRRIPEVARSLGAGLRELRRAVRDVQREVDLEGLAAPPIAPRPPEHEVTEAGSEGVGKPPTGVAEPPETPLPGPATHGIGSKDD